MAEEFLYNLFIEEIVDSLQRGNVASFPTETVYALAVDAANKEAIESLRKMKNRSEKKSFAILVESIEALCEIANTNTQIINFIKYFAPGPITFILMAKSTLSTNMPQDGSVAIRIPRNKISLSILKKFKNPLIATSANISGMPPIVKADEIRQLFPNIYVLKDDSSCSGVASTVVDISSPEITILRSGELQEDIIRNVWVNS